MLEKNLIQSVYTKIQSRIFSYQPACNSGQAQTTTDLFPLLSRAPPTPESKGESKKPTLYCEGVRKLSAEAADQDLTRLS